MGLDTYFNESALRFYSSAHVCSRFQRKIIYIHYLPSTSISSVRLYTCTHSCYNSCFHCFLLQEPSRRFSTEWIESTKYFTEPPARGTAPSCLLRTRSKATHASDVKVTLNYKEELKIPLLVYMHGKREIKARGLTNRTVRITVAASTMCPLWPQSTAPKLSSSPRGSTTSRTQFHNITFHATHTPRCAHARSRVY